MSTDESSNPASTPPVTAEGEAFVSEPRRVRSVKIPAPVPGSSVPIAPGVHWARIPLPIELDHINVWLVETADGCIVVDTGMSVGIGRDAWEAIAHEQFTEHPLRGVFVTHIHPDHLGLAAWMQERFGVPVWMSSRTHELARLMASASAAHAGEARDFFIKHGVQDLAQVEPLFRPERFSRMTSGVPQVERYVEDGHQLLWGGAEWTALETNGHAEGHLCLANAQGRLLISGDQVLPTISSNISFTFRNADPNPLGSYLSSLQRLRQLDGETLVLPSHGIPFHGLQQRIDDLTSHHEAKLAALRRLCVEPKSAGELLGFMFRRELKGMHLFLALGEALAHMEYLVQAGDMTSSAAGGVQRYVTIARGAE